MIVPVGVISCLYGGIMDKIDFIKKIIEWDREDNRDILKNYYENVVEAIEFYNEHCILSAKYLNDALNELTPVYNEYMGLE
jgi:hypothetical protein